ncbi:MAG: tetratricopeptide repeat protein, partial [Spirochaetaceae bacterium]
MIKFKYFLAFILFLYILSSKNSFADPTLGSKVSPAFYFPIDSDLLEEGFGTSLQLDYNINKNFNLLLEGEYISIGLDEISSLSLIGGSIGAEYIQPLTERFSLREGLKVGLYSVNSESDTLSGISTGANISGDFKVTPSITASLFGGYDLFATSSTPFMQSFSIGISLSTNFSEAINHKNRVEVSMIENIPIFPVFYSWYDENSFGSIAIKNNENTSITDISVSFYMEQYMKQPKRCSSIKKIKPGESIDVPLTAFFDSSILELNEKVRSSAQIIVEYRRLGVKEETSTLITQQIFHRNAMSWDDDRKAAAFVSSKDPAALWFAKFVTSIVSEKSRKSINKNIQIAISMFEALNVYGTNYVVDPSSSYAELASNSSSIDFLQYPYQTLMYRGGDCDDLSILFCSLLEAVGINTAFITIPGHIFMAFDSGLSENEARAVFLDSNKIIYENQKAWIPLETTMLKEGFNKAWSIGAKEWRDASSAKSASLLPMKESWARYSPVSVPGAISRFNLPSKESTIKAFTSSLDKYVANEIAPRIQEEIKLSAGTTGSISLESRNAMGVSYGSYGMLIKAKEEFIMAAKSDSLHPWVNLGNIFYMEGNYEEAIKYYSYVLTVDGQNSLSLLGIARCYYELDDFRKSDSLYSKLRSVNFDLASEFSYLGSFFETTGRAWSFSDRLETTIWSLPVKIIEPIIESKVIVKKSAILNVPKIIAKEPEPVIEPV